MKLISKLNRGLLIASLCIAGTARAATIDTFEGTTLNTSAYTAYGAGAFSQNNALRINALSTGFTTYVTDSLTLGARESVQVDVRVNASASSHSFAAFLGLQQNSAALSQGGRESLVSLGGVANNAVFWHSLTNVGGSGDGAQPALQTTVGADYTLRLDRTSPDSLTARIFSDDGGLLSSWTKEGLLLPSQMYVVLGAAGSDVTFDNLRTGDNSMPFDTQAHAVPLPGSLGAGLALMTLIACRRHLGRR